MSADMVRRIWHDAGMTGDDASNRIAAAGIAWMQTQVSALMLGEAKADEQAARNAVVIFGGVERVREVRFACSHVAFMPIEHPLEHPHYCPRCDGRRAPCDVQYVHAGRIG